MIAGKLVKEMLRIKLTDNPLLVDLLDIQRASRAVRVPDLEINSGNCAFSRITRCWELPCRGGAGCPRDVVGIVVVVNIGSGSWWSMKVNRRV